MESREIGVAGTIQTVRLPLFWYPGTLLRGRVVTLTCLAAIQHLGEGDLEMLQSNVDKIALGKPRFSFSFLGFTV